MRQLLRVLVGSHAHGLDTPESDMDFRGVFQYPTSQLVLPEPLRDFPLKETSWVEGKTDDTSWELGHFMHLATMCNPTILEVFKSTSFHPVGEERTVNKLGDELQALFPYVWDSDKVIASFVGYSRNQRKKFIEDVEAPIARTKTDPVRPQKYATAYIRTLYNAVQLLTTGDFKMSVRGTEIEEICRKWKIRNEFTPAEVLQTCLDWEARVYEAHKSSPKHEQDLRPLREFVQKVRKEYWE